MDPAAAGSEEKCEETMQTAGNAAQKRGGRFCVAEKGKKGAANRGTPPPWSERKGRGGRRKQTSTARNFCPNPECEYYRIDDEKIHALVWDGKHGKHETIRDLKCQACGKKFTSRKNTILYRLKTDPEKIGKILHLLAGGGGWISAGRGVWRAEDHNSIMAVPEWDAGQEVA